MTGIVHRRSKDHINRVIDGVELFPPSPVERECLLGEVFLAIQAPYAMTEAGSRRRILDFACRLEGSRS